MNLQQLVEIIDGACWDARRYGHEDCGLDDFAVGLDGKWIDDPHEEGYHPSAVKAAKQILAPMEVE